MWDNVNSKQLSHTGTSGTVQFMVGLSLEWKGAEGTQDSSEGSILLSRAPQCGDSRSSGR